MILRTEWDRAVEVLASSDEVVVACHVHPDGDALGSMIGLGRFLARLGKKVQVGWGSSSVRIPPQFAFLPGADSLSAPSQMPAKPETFVAIDCGGVSRLQLLQSSFEGAGTTINIDHHLSNTRFGEINLVDPEAASSSELAYELIRRTGGTPDLDEATCFYAGIVTDTGRFQHAGTSAATLRVAAELRELGADHERVALEVYESAAFAYLHVLGVVLSRAQLLDGLVWSWLDQQDLVGIGLDETEELIDVLRAVREGRVAMVLKQLGDGSYKVSL
ncbi:MAG: DHH family phosphoesterase, partial [Candidatus Methylomirabilales bacterium]